MLVNYWTDPRPRSRRRPTTEVKHHKLVTIPSPFAPENRQFYASVDHAFDAGEVEVAPGIIVDRAAFPAEDGAEVHTIITASRHDDLEADREF